MRTVMVLPLTLYFVLIFTSNAFYCGNNPYDTQTSQCVCDNLSCCTPELYPNVCCENSTLPLPFLGEWILADTNDPNNRIDATLPMIISYSEGVPYLVQIPWFNVPGGPVNITYNFTAQYTCDYTNYLSTNGDPYYFKMTIYANPPYLSLNMSYDYSLGTFVPVNQNKLDLIS